jgi:hypothetical protein
MTARAWQCPQIAHVLPVDVMINEELSFYFNAKRVSDPPDLLQLAIIFLIVCLTASLRCICSKQDF